jgi:hypothetical protein
MWKTWILGEWTNSANINNGRIEIKRLTLIPHGSSHARNFVSGQDLTPREGVNPQAFPQIGENLL